MKTPIEPADIRAGDLIRWESSERSLSLKASEYRAEKDEDSFTNPGDHFLLDRPTPPVELPAMPTLGWLTIEGRESDLDVWQADNETIRTPHKFKCFVLGKVTAFTPAVAVPKAALDELRAWDDDTGGDRGTYEVLVARRERIQHFLAAVDKANS